MAFARSNLDGGGKPLTYWQQRRAIEREARQAERRGGALGAPVAKGLSRNKCSSSAKIAQCFQCVIRYL